MHILIDIGNSTIVVALADQEGNIAHTWRFKTRKEETVTFFRYELKQVDIESPSQLGKDRLADALGAVACYGVPAIVIDFGTATTFGVVDAQRRFLGGLIIPGVKTSLNALSQRASQLPAIFIEKPQHLIGRNTLECMQSGILNGTAAMIDGLLDRLLPTLGDTAPIIATGGMAKDIVPQCHHQIQLDKYLLFKGLFKATRQK